MRFILSAGSFLALGLTSSFAAHQSDALTRFSYTEYHMGVDARLVVYAKDKDTAERACIAAFARIAALDTIMSDYRKDSELNRLCDKAGGPPVAVSDDLFRVLTRAQEISRKTRGAFDVTVGPLIQLWRAARKSSKLPTHTEIQNARKIVGWRKIRLDPKAKAVRLTLKGMRLDLGGIAKGLADDEAQKVLKSFGITRALVEMGGDIVVSGPPPGATGWKIMVPNAGKDLYFSNCAVSTSGDTEQFVVIGGKQYSHVVDPRTGMALTNRVQATIVAKDGFTSDPLSKVVALLGRREGTRVLKAYGVKNSYVKVLRPGK